MRRIIKAALVVATVLAIGLTGSASAYPSGSDGNHAANWNDQFSVPASCVKYEPFDESAPVALWVGNDGVVLDPGTYVALILKSALVNDAFVDPIPGNLYLTASFKDISHIIVCTPEEVTPSTTPSVEPSTSPSPTPTATPSSTTTPTPSASPSETSSPTPSTAPSPTPTLTPTNSPPPSATNSPLPSAQPTAPPTDTEQSSVPASDGWGTLAKVIVFAAVLFWLTTLIDDRNRRRR